MQEKCPQCGAPLDGECCGYCGYRISLDENERKTRREEIANAQAAPRARRTERPPQGDVEPIFHDEELEKAPRERIAYGVSQRKRSTALLLCLFLGFSGAHRFYTSKIWTGLLYLFTFGLRGVGWAVDFVLLLTGAFRDRYDLPLQR